MYATLCDKIKQKQNRLSKSERIYMLLANSLEILKNVYEMKIVNVFLSRTVISF